jgi:hypothetical protein
LSSSTCVGLRYGYAGDSLEDFPGGVESTTLWPCGLVTGLTVKTRRICLSDPAYAGKSGHPSPDSPILPRPPIVKRLHHSSGILTGCPSTTPFGLALGPTNPERINLSQEPLDFRRPRFSLGLSLLMPAGSLPIRLPVLSVELRTDQNVLLPNQRSEDLRSSQLRYCA